MELVSIIMPVYNGEKYIAESIGSVLNQDYPHFELICIDDCSTDNTREIIASFKDARIKYICAEDHRGAPAPIRNIGIRASTGTYITFLDHDDVYLPDNLSFKMEYFKQHPDISFAYSDCYIIDENGKLLSNSTIANSGKKPHNGRCFEQLFLGIFIPTQGVILKNSVLSKVGLFNEALVGAEDYELWLRIAYHYEIGFIERPLAKWRHHRTSLSKNVIVMDEGFVHCLESIMRYFPDVVRSIGRKRSNKRLFSLTFDVAFYYYQQGQWNSALKWLVKSLKYKKAPKIIFKIIFASINIVLTKVTPFSNEKYMK